MIQEASGNRIVVELPGVDDPERVRRVEHRPNRLGKLLRRLVRPPSYDLRSVAETLARHVVMMILGLQGGGAGSDDAYYASLHHSRRFADHNYE